MKIAGLMMVRNEADILRINLLHHLAAGIDEFLVVDNGSSDGSEEILEELAKDGRIRWRRDDGAYRQAEITTEMAREAHARGADWVIPIDADEFWYAPGGDLRAVLGRSEAAGIEVQVTNFIQRRDRERATAEGLLLLTRCTPTPVGTPEEVRELVKEGRYAFVEVTFPAKWISRATESINIGMGNHAVSGVGQPTKSTDEIVCLHAPLRAKSVLETRASDHGKRAEELDLDESAWWQARRWRLLAQQAALDKEWAANSYADKAIDVYGARHPVVFDPRLRDLVRPWVEAEAGETRGSSKSKTARVRPVLAEQLPESVDDLQAELRIAHQERQDLLRTIRLQLAAAPRERERAVEKLSDNLELRDRTILDLGNELRSRVGERDETIRSLQQELDEKITSANQTIRSLQAEMQEKLVAASREKEEKVLEANQTIEALRTEMREKVGDANRIIGELRAEMRDRAEEADSEHAKQEQKITALYNELTHIKRSKTWRLLQFYLGVQQKLLKPFR